MMLKKISDFRVFNYLFVFFLSRIFLIQIGRAAELLQHPWIALTLLTFVPAFLGAASCGSAFSKSRNEMPTSQNSWYFSAVATASLIVCLTISSTINSLANSESLTDMAIFSPFKLFDLAIGYGIALLFSKIGFSFGGRAGLKTI